ncbi:hypothetical protein [Polyangium mundeleinium]|uniref:Uncharacterized protein n=1 Tax=Polyangium mundeleinium TaxID=2995306 RepID=A0ABT5EWE4_9BACT|nr:hypothetical protein [Polyangium mundeleinium]MDC0745106.1 hypothetical protein [Polyangium mundeleinium]
MEELRDAQFFQRAGGKTMKGDFKPAAGTLLVEPAASPSWLAGSSLVLSAAVR